MRMAGEQVSSLASKRGHDMDNDTDRNEGETHFLVKYQ